MGICTRSLLTASLILALFSIVFEATLLFYAYRYFMRKTPIFTICIEKNYCQNLVGKITAMA